MATTNEITLASSARVNVCFCDHECNFCLPEWYETNPCKETVVRNSKGDAMFVLANERKLKSKFFRFESNVMPEKSLYLQSNSFDKRKGACWQEYLDQHYSANPHHPQCQNHNTEDLVERIVDVVSSISRTSDCRRTLIKTSIAALKAQGDLDRFPESKLIAQQTFSKLIPYIFGGKMDKAKLMAPKQSVREWRDPEWVKYCFASLYPTSGMAVVPYINTLVKNHGKVHTERLINRFKLDFLPFKRCMDEINVHIESVERIMETLFGRKISHDHDKLYFPMAASYFVKWAGLDESTVSFPIGDVNNMHAQQVELMTFARFRKYNTPPTAEAGENTVETEPASEPESEGIFDDLKNWIVEKMTPTLYTDTKLLVSEATKTSRSVTTASEKTTTLLETIQGGLTALSGYLGPGMNQMVQTFTENKEFLTIENLFKASTLLTNILILRSTQHRILNGILLLETLGVDFAYSKEVATAVYNAFAGSQNEAQSKGILVKEDVTGDESLGDIKNVVELAPTSVTSEGPLLNMMNSAEKIMAGSVIPLGTGFLLFILIARFLKMDAQDQPECHWTRYFAKYGQFARDVIGLATMTVFGFEALLVIFKFVASVYTYLRDWFQVNNCDKDDEQLIAEVQVWKEEVNNISAYTPQMISQEKDLQNRLNLARNAIVAFRRDVIQRQTVKSKPVYHTLLMLLSSSEKELNDMYKSVDAAHRVDPSRPTPFAVRLIGDAGVGKSILSKTLAYQLCAMANIVPKQSEVTFSWDFADKFKQGYNMEPVVIMDDPEINAANNDAFATLILMISKTPYYVPKATVLDKDYCFKSPFIIVNTNIKEFTNDNIKLRCKEAYMRRFMHVVVDALPGVAHSETHSNLRFTVESKNPTTNWMTSCKKATYPEFLKVLEDNYRKFTENQDVVDAMYEKEYAELVRKVQGQEAPTAEGDTDDEGANPEEVMPPLETDEDVVEDELPEFRPAFPKYFEDRNITWKLVLAKAYAFNFERLMAKAIRSKFAKAGSKFAYPSFLENCSTRTKLMFAQIMLGYTPDAIMALIMRKGLGSDSEAVELAEALTPVREDIESLMQSYNKDPIDFVLSDVADDDSRFASLSEIMGLYDVYVYGEGLLEDYPNMDIPDSIPAYDSKVWREAVVTPEMAFAPDVLDWLKSHDSIFTPELIRDFQLGVIEFSVCAEAVTKAQTMEGGPKGVNIKAAQAIFKRRMWRWREDTWIKIKKAPQRKWLEIKSKIPPWVKKFFKTCLVVLPIAGALTFLIVKLLGTDTYHEELAQTQGTMKDSITSLMRAGYVIATRKIIAGKEVLVAEGNPYDAAQMVSRKSHVQVCAQAGANISTFSGDNNERIYRKAVAGGLSLISLEMPTEDGGKLVTYHATALKGQWFMTSRHVGLAIRKRLPETTVVRVMNRGYVANISPNDLEIHFPYEKVDVAFFRPKTNTVPAAADITKHFVTEVEVNALSYTPIKMPVGELEASKVRKTTEDLIKYPFDYQVVICGATRIANQRYTDSGEEYMMARGYRYNHSARGNCGWPVFSGTVSCPKLIGLHTAGDRGTGTGYCNIITREMLDIFFQKEEKVDDISATCEATVNATRFYTPEEVPELPEGDYAFLERLSKEKSTHLPTKIPYKKMPTYNQIAIDDREPAPQSSRDPRNIFKENILRNCAEKYAMSGLPFSTRFLTEFHDGFTQEMMTVQDDGNIILNYEQSLNGVQFSHIEPINLRTSAGYPFTLDKTRPPGKGSYVVVHEDKTKSFTPEFQAILDATDELDKCTVAVDHTYSDAIKVELLPMEKTRPYLYSKFYVETEPSEQATAIYVGPKQVDFRQAMFLDQVEPTRTFKPRLIDVPSIVQTVQSRMTNAGFNNFLMQNRHRFGILIGINPESSEWGLVMDKMREVSTTVQDFDFKNFDGCHQRSVIMMIARIYHSFNMRDEEYAHNPVLQHRHFRIWDSVMTRVVVMGSLRYRVHHGIPSGSDCTSQINTLAQDFYYFVAWKTLMLEAKKNELATYREYRHHVRTVKYGDDGLMSVSPVLEEIYSAENIARVLKPYGVNIQPADKFIKGFPPPRPIEKVTFLSRGFVQHPEYPGVYYAPLKQESVDALLNWAWVTGRDETDAFQQNLVEHLRHYYPKGEIAYRLRVKDITRKCLIQNFPVPAFPLWIELETAFLEAWGIVENSVALTEGP